MADDVRELRLSVTAPDYEAALRFYRDVLGLRERATYTSDGGHVTILDAGRATLELADPAYATYIDEVEVGSRVAGHLRVAFEVTDTATTTPALAAAGATVVADPVRTPWGSLNARLDAPGGLHVTLFSNDIHLTARTRLDGPVVLADPDPAWPGVAAGLMAGIREALGGGVLLLEHVGSTSVPHLPAKPLIDLVLAVADPTDEATYVPALEAVGYQLHIREPEWHEHRLLKLVAVNLHVFAVGSDEVDRMVAFRDHLREDSRDRDLYAAAKVELAARTWTHVQDYADAKSEVVADIMTRALRRTPSMAGVFVLVSGPPASGKTTLARELAPHLGLPLLSQDTIDEAIAEALPVTGIDDPPRIARAGAAVLLAVAHETHGAVLEGPWYRDSETVLAGLRGRVVQVRCHSDRTGAESMTGQVVAGGWPVLEVDTTAPVDVPRLARAVRQSVLTPGRP